MVTVFLYSNSIPLPRDSSGWSSLTAAGESELRRTGSGLSVGASEGEGD